MTTPSISATVAAKRRMPLKPQKPPAEPKKYPSGSSGKHTRPSIVFRPESDEELEAITRAAERAGVTRNDWLREAAREKLVSDPTNPRPKAWRK